MTKPSREHMRRVLQKDYCAVRSHLLVHRSDAPKAESHATNGIYNGIVLISTEDLGVGELNEIIDHEQDCTATGDMADGYIDWDEHPEPDPAEPRKWALLACVEKRGQGQRFFSTKGLADPTELWICDNSGDDPDRTDDGPLRLDTERKVEVGQDPGSRIGVYAMVPVIGERHAEKSRCGVTIRELLWLVRHGWIKPDRLEFSESLQPLLDLLRVKAL